MFNISHRPGEKNSGAEGVEYPTRFFARYTFTGIARNRLMQLIQRRDYAGNRLEFTL